MVDSEMREITRALVGDPRYDSLIEPYLEIAKSAIVSRLFPYRKDAWWGNVPDKYHMAACDIACYLINKRGAEGEISHSESGVSRTYGSATIPDRYFAGMMPYVGVPEPCETSSETDE